MLEKLLINDNAYFYKRVRAIPKNKINQIFTEVSKEKKLSNRYSLKAIKSVATVGMKASIILFVYSNTIINQVF